jgi:hypothetical protein
MALNIFSKESVLAKLFLSPLERGLTSITANSPNYFYEGDKNG